MGRKAKRANDRRSVYVQIRMMPIEAESLQQLADDHCCSVSAMVRWVVRQHVMGERSDVALQNAIAQTNGVAK